MILCKWENLPENMRNEEVKPYYQMLERKRKSIILKLIFDRIAALAMLILLSPVFIIMAILIKLDSPGDVFFRQERVTKYGRKFKIHKFRTMVQGADKKGSKVTAKGDARITNLGRKLRACRLDELPQLIDVLQGNMSFVGMRPPMERQVKVYTPKMMATLLMPTGVTSETSIEYKDEGKLLENAEDVDKVYEEVVLPQKMEFNLRNLERFSFFSDIKTMFKTAKVVFFKC